MPDTDPSEDVEEKLADLQIQTSDAKDSVSLQEPSRRTIEEDETAYVTGMPTFAYRSLILLRRQREDGVSEIAAAA